MSDTVANPTVWSRALTAADAVIVRVARFGADHWVIVTIGLALLLYLPCLGQQVIHLEEDRRAMQAIALRDGSSWWLLDVGGERYVGKPPMMAWLIALASFVTGEVNEWAVRLPSVLLVIVAALATGGIARLLVPAEENRNLAAWGAGVAFLCCPSTIERVRIGETDVAVTAFIALAVLIFAAGYCRERIGIWAWVGVSGALAAAALTKGPIPLGFAAIPIIAMTAVQRPRTQLLPAIIAIAVALVPLGIWALLNFQNREAGVWIQEMRIGNLPLLLDPMEFKALLHLNQIPRWLVGMLPWIGFAALYLWHTRRNLWRNPMLRLVLLYALPLSAIVLLWPGAKGRYALPAIVPMMALAGVALAMFWNELYVRVAFAWAAVTLAIAAVLIATVLTGRTASQREQRANIAALASILQGRSAGRLFTTDRDYSLIAYAQRRVITVNPEAIGCALPLDTLIVKKNTDGERAALAIWKRALPIGTSAYVAFTPDPTTPRC